MTGNNLKEQKSTITTNCSSETWQWMKKNILPPSLNLSICSNCLNLILGYVWRYLFCSSKPEFHPWPWQSLLPGKTGQPSTRETGLMQLHATFDILEKFWKEKNYLKYSFYKNLLKMLSLVTAGQKGYQARIQDILKGGGWGKFLKKAQQANYGTYILSRLYTYTLDICSHVFIQLLHIYSYKLTKQYHYSHSGCLIVYKKRRCSQHEFGSPVM